MSAAETQAVFLTDASPAFAKATACRQGAAMLKGFAR
jgi:hypothetical protein